MDCSEFRSHLDALIDGELSEALRMQMNDHAANCETCRRELAAAEQIRDFLSGMDDSVAVPLPAQAAWRGAVHAEARRRRMKRVYGAIGAVAAVCVLTLSVSTLLTGRSGVPASVGSDAPVSIESESASLKDMAPMAYAYVEADGVSEDAALEASAAPNGRGAVMSYAELKVAAEDAETAYGYVQDIVAEYGAVVEREAEDTGGRKLYVLVPDESVTDFINAVNCVGTGVDAGVPAVDVSAGMAGICVIIAQN